MSSCQHLMNAFRVRSRRSYFSRGGTNERSNAFWKEMKIGSSIHWAIWNIRATWKCCYRLTLPPEMSGVHNVFHVSILKKYTTDSSHVSHFDPVQLKEDLSYEEKPVQILDWKEKEVRNKKIALVKVLWRNHSMVESTWEREDEMCAKYPELF